MNACIFAGPTVPLRDEARALDATWLPPARQGDVYRAVSLLRPQAIAIVDGYFQWVPSVRHKEILWALHQGVHVFGAASMGALRAAELAPYGMRGVGRIFEAYRDGRLDMAGDEPFEDDDEVAVVHGPPESGYVSMSEAMVNIRCTLAHAERARVIAADTRARLAAIAKALFFPERSYEELVKRGREAALPEAELTALEAWLPEGRINQKRIDALAMLETMHKFLATDPAPMRAGFTFEHTTFWDSTLAALQSREQHEADEALVLDELRLDDGRVRELRGEVLRTLLMTPESDMVGEGGSGRPEAHDSDGEHRMEELEREEFLHRAEEAVPAFLIERQMIARLRALGEYGRLLARAQNKRACLAGCTDLPHVEEFSELQHLELQDWFFSQLQGRDIPDDLDGYLRESGWDDESRFHGAVFAEYVYRQMADSSEANPGGILEGA